MFAFITRFIEKHPSIHRAALFIWRQFPPRLAGFLKGKMARNWHVGAVAVIVDDNVQPPEILLVEHSYRRKGAWGLPGGALESIDGDPNSLGHCASPDDVIEEALRREVWEELGIEIDVIRLLRVDAVPYVVEEPGLYRLDFYYRCLPVQGFNILREDLASKKAAPTSPEIKQMRLVTLTDLSGFYLYSTNIRFLNNDLPRIEPSLRYKSGD